MLDVPVVIGIGKWVNFHVSVVAGLQWVSLDRMVLDLQVYMVQDLQVCMVQDPLVQ